MWLFKKKKKKYIHIYVFFFNLISPKCLCYWSFFFLLYTKRPVDNLRQLQKFYTVVPIKMDIMNQITFFFGPLYNKDMNYRQNI